MSDIIDNLHATTASVVLITDSAGPLSPGKVKGVITNRELADAVVEATDLYRG